MLVAVLSKLAVRPDKRTLPHLQVSKFESHAAQKDAEVSKLKQTLKEAQERTSMAEASHRHGHALREIHSPSFAGRRSHS